MSWLLSYGTEWGSNMALKKEAVENFFKVSQQHATAQKMASALFIANEEDDDSGSGQTRHKPDTKST